MSNVGSCAPRSAQRQHVGHGVRRSSRGRWEELSAVSFRPPPPGCHEPVDARCVQLATSYVIPTCRSRMDPPTSRMIGTGGLVSLCGCRRPARTAHTTVLNAHILALSATSLRTRRFDLSSSIPCATRASGCAPVLLSFGRRLHNACNAASLVWVSRLSHRVPLERLLWLSGLGDHVSDASSPL